tara:strand:+ start:43 stop:534 length:492 start_codon:yes stop_codon:yes gene_type:complete
MSENVQSLFMSKTSMALILVFVVLIIIACVIVYYQYVEPKLNPSTKFVPNKEFVVSDPYKSEAYIYLFYVDWCPHSKTALPEWLKIKKKYNNIRVNNMMVRFIEYDCEKDEGIKKADEFNVKGFPTIILEKVNLKGKENEREKIEFDAKPDYDTLEEFINTVI